MCGFETYTKLAQSLTVVLTVRVLAGTGVDGTGAAAGGAGNDAFGLKAEVKAPNISTMMESAFKSGGTGGWGAAADSAGSVPHEQLMEQYVKDKMGGEEGGDAKEEEDGAGEGNNMLSEEDRLYTIPEDFKKKVGRSFVDVAVGGGTMAENV